MIHIIYKKDRENFISEFNSYLDKRPDGFLLIISPDDTYKNEQKGEAALNQFADKLARILERNPSAALVTPKKLFQFPNRITGIMFNMEVLSKTDLRLNPELPFNYEADFLIDLVAEHDYLICQDVEYFQSEPGDGNYREFEGIYEKAWYTENIDHYLLPKLKSYEGNVPVFVQFYTMYYIACRLDANMNNNNRHVLNSEEVDQFREKLHEVLQYIEDDVIMGMYDYPVYKKDFQYQRMLLRFKYDDDSKSGLEFYDMDRLRCNIQFMDYRNGSLEIDGSFPDTVSKDVAQYYFEMNGEKYPLQFCERYGLTKFFGRSAYKRLPFHVSVPLEKVGDITVHVVLNGEDYQIPCEFKSHTSRLAVYPYQSYWHFSKYIASTIRDKDENEKVIVTAIKIRRYNFFKMAAKEIGIGAELLFSFQMHRFRFFLLRAAWVVTRPYFKNKNIWMFFDKIYKAGDSSEYLYKYASAQIQDKAGKENAKYYPDKLYYLVDEKTPDYKRLIEEGYKPLKRGSFLHRLVFLNANMMIVSNSTVFAFNDYYLENSRYIRGIPDFHTVCVQHGLSVQKIALAQQRLRDNTRLYFCASKYEIENLSHPVYDYVGYDALKLTGVPRYDGLINEDKKKIMISPTWRMQSAMMVSKNEGVERDYNPFFKDTDYYKVYNGLINDKRLIDAAKEYGYRIAYVLHPIVSPQAKDFDKNEFVDVIPSVGDMSYEKMFRESSLIVTDYSGIQFDFAYMRKPLVYYHPEELEAHYEEGTFHYDTMAFGEIVKKRDELVDLLIDYMKNGCKMKQKYIDRANDFYEFDDHNNCKRIFDEMVKYQKGLSS